MSWASQHPTYCVRRHPVAPHMVRFSMLARLDRRTERYLGSDTRVKELDGR
jgi:hypothetical protein